MGTLARRLWISPGEISIEHRGHLLAQSPPSTVRKPTSERMEQKGKVGFSLCEEAHAASVLGCLLVLTSDSLVDTHILCWLGFFVNLIQAESCGDREPQVRNRVIRLPVGKSVETSSYLMTDVRRHSLLWAVPQLVR